MSYTKTQHAKDVKGLKFTTSDGKQLDYLITTSDHAKVELFAFINGLTSAQQIDAINDYLHAYVGTDSHDRKYKQVKQWCSRVVESLGHPRILISVETGFSVQWPKGIATIKKASIAKKASSKSNGSKTTATKKANKKTVQKAAKITAQKTVKPVSETDTPPTVDSVSEAINDNQIIVDFDNLAALSDDTVLILFNAMSNELTLRALEQKQA